MSLLVIRDVRVFDGVSDRAIERASVVVEGARIREVVVGAATPPRDARVLDGRGGTLLPGFVDMHSHLVSELGARLYLANGVTTVRFAGNDPDAVLALREAIEAARVPGPASSRWGRSSTGSPPTIPAMSWPLYSAAEARLAVQRLKADYRVDGIILTQKPALEVARAAVDEAHRLGIGVTGQTWSLTAREAVALGYDGLENTSRLPEAPRALPETALLRYRTIPERSAMLAHLWARAEASRLERLGHQMVKYETYLVPTLAGMDAILGRYTARIRRDGDTRRLPARARQDLGSWLGQRFFGAAWTPRDFAELGARPRPLPPLHPGLRAPRRARPRRDGRAQALRRVPLPRGAPPAPRVRAVERRRAAGRDRGGRGHARPTRPRPHRAGRPGRPRARRRQPSPPPGRRPGRPGRRRARASPRARHPAPPSSNPNRVRRLP